MAGYVSVHVRRNGGPDDTYRVKRAGPHFLRCALLSDGWHWHCLGCCASGVVETQADAPTAHAAAHERGEA